MTIRDLLNSVPEIQGDVVVRQWNEDRQDYDVESDLWELPSDSGVIDKEITYLYASVNPNRDIEKSALIIEIVDDAEEEHE